jgi:hypothetical protein
MDTFSLSQRIADRYSASSSPSGTSKNVLFELLVLDLSTSGRAPPPTLTVRIWNSSHRRVVSSQRKENRIGCQVLSTNHQVNHQLAITFVDHIQSSDCREDIAFLSFYHCSSKQACYCPPTGTAAATLLLISSSHVEARIDFDSRRPEHTPVPTGDTAPSLSTMTPPLPPAPPIRCTTTAARTVVVPHLHPAYEHQAPAVLVSMASAGNSKHEQHQQQHQPIGSISEDDTSSNNSSRMMLRLQQGLTLRDIVAMSLMRSTSSTDPPPPRPPLPAAPVTPDHSSSCTCVSPPRHDDPFLRLASRMEPPLLLPRKPLPTTIRPAPLLSSSSSSSDDYQLPFLPLTLEEDDDNPIRQRPFVLKQRPSHHLLRKPLIMMLPEEEELAAAADLLVQLPSCTTTTKQQQQQQRHHKEEQQQQQQQQRHHNEEQPQQQHPGGGRPVVVAAAGGADDPTSSRSFLWIDHQAMMVDGCYDLPPLMPEYSGSSSHDSSTSSSSGGGNEGGGFLPPQLRYRSQPQRNPFRAQLDEDGDDEDEVYQMMY